MSPRLKSINNRRSILFICHTAVIAALYVVLTLISHVFGLTQLLVQIRFSEALCILPFFTSAAVPGLTIGCVIANLLTGCAPWDIVLGSAATLIGALTAYILSAKLKSKGYEQLAVWLVPIPNIISNTLVLPPVIAWLYGTSLAMPILALTVLGGEAICCAVLGIPLLFALNKAHIRRIFR